MLACSYEDTHPTRRHRAHSAPKRHHDDFGSGNDGRGQGSGVRNGLGGGSLGHELDLAVDGGPNVDTRDRRPHEQLTERNRISIGVTLEDLRAGSGRPKGPDC